MKKIINKIKNFCTKLEVRVITQNPLSSNRGDENIDKILWIIIGCVAAGLIGTWLYGFINRTTVNADKKNDALWNAIAFIYSNLFYLKK